MGIVYKAGKLLYHAGKVLTDCCIGACCVDGTCSQKSQCECQGTFQGVASTCDPNPCEGGGGSGACCLPDGTCTDNYATQEECEDCTPGKFMCADVIGRNEDGSCPSGYSPWTDTLCKQEYEVADCGECFADCYPTDGGPCGTWHAGKTCAENPCAQVCCLWGWCYDIGEFLSAGDCTYYGGTVINGTCAGNPCPTPPTGACCDPYYGGCYNTTEFDCSGTWKGPGTTCISHPCAFPGACCVEGECQEVASEAACTALGGVYQGANSTCEDGDCGGGCCGDAVCSAAELCRPGYFASRCSGLGGTACDTSLPNPNPSGVSACQSAVTTATVTASGHVVGTPGSQTAADLEAQDAMNSTYAVLLGCNGNGSATFLVGDVRVYVFASVGAYTVAGIDVRRASDNARFCATDSPRGTNTLIAASACGLPIYDCQGVSGAAVFGPTSYCGGSSASYVVALS